MPSTAHPDRTLPRTYGLLGGRVRLRDWPDRDRPAIDAPLLAAAAPAAGTVLDAGCGGGAVGLCLAARLPQARITALDISTAAVAETAGNVEENGWNGRFEVVQRSLAAFRADGFELVLSNPPYHDPASSRAGTPDRDQARFGEIELGDWLGHCLRLCRPRGHLVVVLRADRIAAAITAIDPAAGDLRILPLYGRAGQPASRVLIRARKAVRSPSRILPGLVLHEADGGWTAAAHRILADAAAIDWESGSIA
ncbi:tRNA1(Val) (adenine(37)-N6)-methyltransferase [Geminicoccus roseus]|uniref:tRNA1(Val) (adenine(37)-N6)-methyltransferase n=1 Tax=Geminicoccus roseus TaxID=404900 RepID=UPI00040AAB0C|nr:methyltransferase [Geminicoccus roseus]